MVGKCLLPKSSPIPVILCGALCFQLALAGLASLTSEAGQRPLYQRAAATVAGCAAVLVLASLPVSKLMGFGEVDSTGAVESTSDGSGEEEESPDLGALGGPIDTLKNGNSEERFEAMRELERILSDPIAAGISNSQLKSAATVLRQWVRGYRYEYYSMEGISPFFKGVHDTERPMRLLAVLELAIKSDAIGRVQRDILASVLITFYEIEVDQDSSIYRLTRYFPVSVVSEVDSIFVDLLSADFGLSPFTIAQLSAEIRLRRPHLHSGHPSKGSYAHHEAVLEALAKWPTQPPAFHKVAPREY